MKDRKRVSGIAAIYCFAAVAILIGFATSPLITLCVLVIAAVIAMLAGFSAAESLARSTEPLKSTEQEALPTTMSKPRLG